MIKNKVFFRGKRRTFYSHSWGRRVQNSISINILLPSVYPFLPSSRGSSQEKPASAGGATKLPKNAHPTDLLPWSSASGFASPELSFSSRPETTFLSVRPHFTESKAFSINTYNPAISEILPKGRADAVGRASLHLGKGWGESLGGLCGGSGPRGSSLLWVQM